MCIETDFIGSSLQLSKPLDGKFTWDEFMNLGPEGGWRQPKRWELIQLFDEARLTGVSFSNTNIVWSASTVAYYSNFACSVDFDAGSSYVSNRSYPFGVRLVKENLPYSLDEK